MDNPSDDAVTDVELPPALKSLKEEMEAFQAARVVADDAEPIEVINPATGRPVRHLHMRLSARDTMRVMSMPVEDRAAMAEAILAERAIEKAAKRTADGKANKARDERKRQAKHRKRSRRK